MQIEIAFRTWNAMQNIIKQHPRTDRYNRIVIYQMKWLDCPLKYIGQTGRIFHTRYKEHILAIRDNNSNSGHSSHILNTGHKYGTVTDTMTIIRTHTRWSYSCSRPWRPIGLWDVEVPAFSRQSAHRWRWGWQAALYPQDHSAAGRIKSIEKSNDLIGNQTRYLPACSTVSQSTTLPRAPL
jgi:hypothetical protein